MVDIPGNNTTTATISVGGSSSDTLEISGDHDWFKITLTQGQAITVSLNGVTLEDPYLRIRDAGGNVIYQNDDIHLGVDLDSLVSFAAPNSGTYYIDVGSYEDVQTPGGTGNYQLSVSAYQAPPTWTNDQIANQLTSGYWGDGIHKFAFGGQTRQLTVNITGLTADGQFLARQALQTWSDITGIAFVESSSPTAQIMFTDDDPDGGAFTESTYSGADISSSHVNVDMDWLNIYGSDVGSYAFQAYIHEIGHALGLGHAGNYNTTANYPYDGLYANDAWNTSVMSYFSQTDNTYFKNQGFTDAHDVTPMVADILAMQTLYGLSSTTRSGNTTYGFNSNAGIWFDATQTTNVAYTIFDTGGTDTLDYSDYFFVQTINLNPETFSNVGGEVGNVTIARGTVIENAIGGDRNDTIIGNSAANVLTGNQGNDTLTGGTGNDTFQDTSGGLSGDTITDFGAGDKIVFTDATLAGFAFNLSSHTLTYSGGSLTLSQAVNGTIVASAAPGGGVQLTIQQAIINDARNDFNGDGRSDVLWRNSISGDVTNWLGQSNGSFVGNTDNAYNNASLAWQIVGVGDFNGDGKDDILWRSNSGTITNWLGKAGGGFNGNIVNSEYHIDANWHVAGVGDFNGDGKDDILWKADDGTVTNWLGGANGSFTGNIGNANNNVANGWQVVGTGDFNNDGRDDVLWRNSISGDVTNWLGQANGSFVGNTNNAYNNASLAWQIVGVGDFNGDGYDDILWRGNDGTITNWLGKAGGGFNGNIANADNHIDANWQVVSVGDFNGDGRDDILWQGNDGTVTNWLGQANGGFVGNFANANNHVDNGWSPQDLFWL